MIETGSAQIVGGRDEQQDAFAVEKMHGQLLAVVADGMGGHAAGATASKQAIRGFIEHLRILRAEELEREPVQCLYDALNAANEQVAAAAEAEPGREGMGTTLVALLALTERVFWVSVGDSPLYLLRDGKLRRINANHSVAALLEAEARQHMINPEEAMSSSARHQLTSALTGGEIARVDLPKAGEALRAGDRFILASDGIHTLTDEAIARLLAEAPSAEGAAANIAGHVQAEELENQDNTTIVGVFAPAAQAASTATAAQAAAKPQAFYQLWIALALTAIAVLFAIWLWRDGRQADAIPVVAPPPEKLEAPISGQTDADPVNAEPPPAPRASRAGTPAPRDPSPDSNEP